ncbi:MAG: hypothetical protein R3F53_26805 [Gammaproteobacteria bacterium]
MSYNLMNSIKFLSKITPIANYYIGVYQARETYKKIIPAIKYICTTKGRNSIEAKGLFEILASLHTSPARASYFRGYYIDDPEGWKKLPDDPMRLPFPHQIH